MGEIARLCGYLPLAIRMLASQLRHHPAWTAAELAVGLAAARDRLGAMRAENLSVAAAFGLSYADLTPAQQRLFRRLGLHPGSDFDAHAAAALDDTGLEEARRRLDELYDQHLLTEPMPGRYRLHDLLREHARALAAADDPAESDAAAGRLLDYYLYTALAASQHIADWATSSGSRRPPEEPSAWTPELSTSQQAAAWLETERPNLHAAAGYAGAHGFPRYAIAIPAAISGFLRVHGYWDQAAALNQAALAIARQADDRAGQASTLEQLGILEWLTGDYPAAAASLQQAEALNNLGELLCEASTSHLARDHHSKALAIAHEIGAPLEEARALEGIGRCHLHDGNPAEGSAHLRQALAICQRIGTADARRVKESLETGG